MLSEEDKFNLIFGERIKLKSDPSFTVRLSILGERILFSLLKIDYTLMKITVSFPNGWASFPINKIEDNNWYGFDDSVFLEVEEIVQWAASEDFLRDLIRFKELKIFA